MSIDHGHDGMLKAIKNNKKLLGIKCDAEKLLSKVDVEVITFTGLAERVGMARVGHLKIDTEGHDPKVIKSMIEWVESGGAPPLSIRFESNALTTPRDYSDTLRILLDKGYHVITRDYCSLSPGLDTDVLLDIPRYFGTVVTPDELTSPAEYPLRFEGTKIQNYPEGYSFEYLPHANTWEGAMRYGLELRERGIPVIGVCLEKRVFTVRIGPYAIYGLYGRKVQVVSWLLVK